MTEDSTTSPATVAVLARTFTRPRACRTCGAPIVLAKTLFGKWLPFAADPRAVRRTLDAEGRQIAFLDAGERHTCGRRSVDDERRLF